VGKDHKPTTSKAHQASVGTRGRVRVG